MPVEKSCSELHTRHSHAGGGGTQLAARRASPRTNRRIRRLCFERQCFWLASKLSAVAARRELLRSLPPRWLCLVGLACLTVLTVWTHGVELRLADVRAAAAAWWAAASAASCPRQRACDGALACYGCRPEELSRCSSQRYTVCKFCSKMCFTDSLKW